METEYKSQALKDFETTWLTLNWTALTATQKQTHIAQHYALKIASAKEAEANRIASEADAVTANAARKQQIIAYLTNHGFNCDNSQHDWDLLYNRPRVFGANWKAQSNYQRSLSTSVDYFLNHAYNLWLDIKDQ